MNINYDYYKVFYYVAKYKSITQASIFLLNNQPNITRIIKTLEYELGCTLFIRSRQGVKLTPEGKKLFEHVKIAVEQIEIGEKEIVLDRNLQSGTIFIGTSEIALHSFLLPVLKDYKQKYPKIKICISNYSTPQAISALKEGAADIAVITSPFEVTSDLEYVVIKRFKEIAVCGSAFSELLDKKLSLTELIEYPLISMDKQTKTYEFYSKFFLKEGIDFSPSVEVATIDQVLPLVKINLGIGFVPEIFLKNLTEEKIYELKLKEKIPERNICLVKRKKHYLSIAAQEFENMIKYYSEKITKNKKIIDNQ